MFSRACNRYSGTPLYGHPLYGHPLNTDTRFIRTVSFVPTESSYSFSKINPALYGHLVIRTADTFLCPESQTLIYCQRRFTDTGYPHTVYFHCHNYHCHNYVIIVHIVPCSNSDRFLRVNKSLLQICAKKNSNEVKSQSFSNESTVMPVSITILYKTLKILLWDYRDKWS